MTTATANKKPSLGSMGKLSSLLKKDEQATSAAPTGKPLELSIDLIAENPNNSRKTFETDEHFEKSIAERGVKSPISVRDDADNPGRYIINHGARRFRASLKAGKTSIPAFIDNDYTDFDNVIENIHREGLKARELADFIGAKLASGMKQKEIAAGLQLSEALVSQHVTLLKLPDPIADVFNQDRCRDVTLINELVKAYKKQPEQVTDFLADESQEISRGSVKLLREFIDAEGKKDAEDGNGETAGAGDDGGSTEPTDAAKPPKEPKQSDPSKMKKAIVQVEHYGRPARLLLDRRPSEIGLAWMKYDDDGEEFEAAITEAKLVGLVEGA